MSEKICVLITCAGSMVIPGMVACLREEKDYEFHIVGVDIHENAVGGKFIDSFYKVPKSTDTVFSDRILEIALKENVDLIIPGDDDSVVALSPFIDQFAKKNIAILSSNALIVETLTDKGKMLSSLKKRGLPTPRFYLPTTLEELDKAVELLCYPKNEIVLKPTRGIGGRGFWILSEKYNGQDLILNERNLQRLPYPVVRSLISEKDLLPPLMVMEYLTGSDFNVDVLSDKGRTLYTIPIKRLVPDAGPVQEGCIIKDKKINKIVQQVVSAFGLSFNTNIELAYRDKLDGANPLIYEINPRISAPIAMHKYAGINLLLFGILLCLGKSIPTNLQYNEIYMQRCWREVYS